MKILILLLYYERPVLVRNALKSILRADAYHPCWELVVIDDGSEAPALPIAGEILAGHYAQISVVETRMTGADKSRHGCMIGLAMNQTIERSDAEAGIMLCDDDALYPTYLRDLSRYFAENPKVLSCYSKVIVYNPLNQVPEESTNMDSPLNRHTTPLNGAHQVDASQGAWRLRCNKEYGVWFSYPLNRNHDAAYYDPLYRQCGPMMPTGVIGQYKGIHERELVFVGPERAWSEKGIDRDASNTPEEPAPRKAFFVLNSLLPSVLE
jgi:hypothetical protein